ncbi:hypothetical protein ES703_110344 [subsurface metagenome]
MLIHFYSLKVRIYRIHKYTIINRIFAKVEEVEGKIEAILGEDDEDDEDED